MNPISIVPRFTTFKLTFSLNTIFKYILDREYSDMHLQL